MARPALYPESLLKREDKNISHHPWDKTIKSIYANRIKYVHNSIENPVYPERKMVNRKDSKNNHKDIIKFTIIGVNTSEHFIYCANLAKGLHKYKSGSFKAPVIKGVPTVNWPSVWNDIKLRFGENAFCTSKPVVILINDVVLGGHKEFKDLVESKYVYRICLDYRKEAIQQFHRFVKYSNSPFAYMHIAVDEKPIGTLIFMLYADIVPKTCENFLRLCNTRKGGYSGTPVHRIVKDGWIQCGGFGLKDTRLGCENFILPHNRRGVLGMCNDGRDIDCSTQFFVLLQPAPWMKCKYVAFGQLVYGEETLKKIEEIETYYEAPVSSIIIYRSGILNLDCTHTTINKHAGEYISKHIEDLVDVGDFFIELLMQHVWAGIVASKRARKEKMLQQERENMEAEGLEETYSGKIKSKTSLESVMSTATSKTPPEEDKENLDFDMDSYTPEEYYYSQVSARSVKSTKSKPFYLPLTDVPYPGETDSNFDLRKFLKGDYCLLTDLEKNLPKDHRQRDLLSMLCWTFSKEMLDFEERDSYSEDEIDSDYEDEMQEYIRNNADRVSFAGQIIRNIGVVGKTQAMVNLFDGARKSEVINLDDFDENFKRRISTLERRVSVKRSTMTFNDEDIRKLRRASEAHRRQSTMEKLSTIADQDKQTSGSPQKTCEINEEQINKLKRISMFADRPSPEKEPARLIKIRESPNLSEDFEDKKKQFTFADELARVKSFQKDFHDDYPKKVSVIQSDIEDHDTHKIKRRPTGFIRPQDLPKVEEDDDDEDEESNEDDDDRRMSAYDAEEPENEPESPAHDSDSSEKFEDEGKKRFQFAQELARIKSFQKDFHDDHSTKKVAVLPTDSEDHDTHKIKRRPTGFIRPQDLPKVEEDDDDDDDEKSSSSSDDQKVAFLTPAEHETRKIIRRPTGFIRPQDLPKVEEDEDEDDEDEDEKSNELEEEAVKEEEKETEKEGKEKEDIEEDLKEEDDEDKPEHLKVCISEPFVNTGMKAKITRRATRYEKSFFPDDDEDDDDDDNHNDNDNDKDNDIDIDIDKDKIDGKKSSEIRESVFLRLYGDAFAVDKDEPPPTLKNYKPLAERTGHDIPSKNFFLASGVNKNLKYVPSTVKRKVDPTVRPPLPDDDSFETEANLKFGKKVSAIISSEYVHTLGKRETIFGLKTAKKVQYSTKRPQLTVAEYQKMNQENLEKMKLEGI